MSSINESLGTSSSQSVSDSKRFRCDAKSFCLTYSNPTAQSSTFPVTLEGFHGSLRGRLEHLGRSPVYFATCLELHESGDIHFHAGFSLETRWNLRDPRSLDIEGVHPNIQSARDFRKWVSYLKKGGQFLEDGTLKEIKEKVPRLTPEELINLARTSEQHEFVAYCSVHRYQNGKDLWNMVHEDNSLNITNDTVIEGTISEKFNKLANNLSWNSNLTLLVVGESGIGKTTWAKQTIPKPCLFVSHIDDLRKFKPSYHVSILFDDVSIAHMPETAQIHICDQENPRSIHCRYGTARIPAGTTKIFTCNSLPVSLSTPAISRRVQVLFAYQDDLDRV